MSLKYVDLDLIEEIREITQEVRCGEVHLFERGLVNSNPFDTGNIDKGMVYFESLPFFSFKSSWDDEKQLGGSELDGVFMVKCSYPVKRLKSGLIAYINFSDESYVVQGVLKEFVVKLSSLVSFTVDINQSIPFGWDVVKGYAEVISYVNS